jgi:outer membrane protein insertion porin family
MTTSSDSMTKRLGNEGYAYAQVKGIPDRNDQDHTVKVTFFVDSSHRAYVRRINFRGNTKTADEVLRREMRQMESASANTAKLEQSKTRLERLGYFKTVNMETTDVPGTGDQIDVEYAVEEQASGSIGASIGFAQGSGVILGGNIQQDNFLGTGKQIGINVSTSSYLKQINFSYMDPYYTVDGVSRGFNLYSSERNLSKVNVSDYSVNNYGLDMNFGYPLSEIERLGFGVGYSHTEINVGPAPVQEVAGSPVFDSGIAYSNTMANISGADLLLGTSDDCGGSIATCGAGFAVTPDPRYTPTYQGFLDRNGTTFDDIKFTGSWSQSTLNKGRLATKGHSQSVSLEATVPGVSDIEFWKLVYKGQYFRPLTDNYTLHLRSRVGYGAGYGKTDELPFFENFYAGGFGSVRGYRRNTLGPVGTPAIAYTKVVLPSGEVVYVDDGTGHPASAPFVGGSSNNDAIGGDALVDGSAEIIFPMPFIKDQSSVQPSIFIDAGNVFDTSCSTVYGVEQKGCSNIDFGELRYSAGVGLTWITGFGPLTFSLAKPLNKKTGDTPEFFQFSLGQTF